MNRVFQRIGETMQMQVLENGLRIYYIPKAGFSKTFAMLATNFGSVDSRFTATDGTLMQIPAGVAHFLEHKMFEDEDGNALQKFSATGASPNAFTSHNMTAYHFSCTEGFAKNLEILTRFVFTPYFTDENVEKEKGIIGQEIGMMQDDPFWRSYVGVYEGLYHTHPVRASIAGSVESIAGITPALLEQCHRAFYTPANMVLVVCGEADMETIADIANRSTPAVSAQPAARDYGTRRSTVAQSETVQHMAVSRPQFMLGVKDDPLQKGESRLRRQLVGDLCCRILAGESAQLYIALYGERLISRRFSAGYHLHPDAACAMFSGDSLNPQDVRARIEAEILRLAEQGVGDALFARAKRAEYGMTLRMLDQPDDICRAQCEAAFAGEDFADFVDIYDTIKMEDVHQVLRRWAQPERTSMSVIMPQI